MANRQWWQRESMVSCPRRGLYCWENKIKVAWKKILCCIQGSTEKKTGSELPWWWILCIEAFWSSLSLLSSLMESGQSTMMTEKWPWISWLVCKSWTVKTNRRNASQMEDLTRYASRIIVTVCNALMPRIFLFVLHQTQTFVLYASYPVQRKPVWSCHVMFVYAWGLSVIWRVFFAFSGQLLWYDTANFERARMQVRISYTSTCRGRAASVIFYISQCAWKKQIETRTLNTLQKQI